MIARILLIVLFLLLDGLNTHGHAAQTPAANRRLQLSAAGRLYVATTGSDAGNSCADSTAPCQTIQYACNEAIKNYDSQSNIIVINVAAGVYHAGCQVAGPLIGSAMGGTTPASLWIVGNVTNPSSVLIADTTRHSAFMAANGFPMVLEGLKITSANGSAVFPDYGSVITILNDEIGATHLGQFHAESSGVVKIGGNYKISGGAPSHLECVLGGQIQYEEIPITVYITGTPHFPQGFVHEQDNCIVYIPKAFTTFSGIATGPKYALYSNSILETNNGTPAMLPGSQLGTLLSGAHFLP